MNETIQIAIAVQNEVTREQLIAHLSAAGFDAFEEKVEELLCYIDGKNLYASHFENILSRFNLPLQQRKLKSKTGMLCG